MRKVRGPFSRLLLCVCVCVRMFLVEVVVSGVAYKAPTNLRKLCAALPCSKEQQSWQKVQQWALRKHM